VKLRNGSTIFLDGADDGAERIQGKNLRGAWCDEIAIWKKWEMAWNVSLAFAVRFEPGRIVCTGTPKIGHGLVRQLIDDPKVPVTRMRMVDNLENLNPHAVQELLDMYGGTRLGEQELEGEWFSEVEGDLLLRSWWRYYPPRRNDETDVQFTGRLPAFTQVVCSWDTPLKDKESSDFVAGQCWGVHGGLRYLLDTRVDRLNYSAAKRAAVEMHEWAVGLWPRAAHHVLIEKGGYGIELIDELKREITGVAAIKPSADGSKGMRAFAASPDLESGNCLLPGFALDDGTGPDELRSPASTVGLVNEASMFRMDGTHAGHDDKVDAWSQAMNWLRARGSRKASMWVPEGTI
jgi:phage terminase large subunit-like protein